MPNDQPAPGPAGNQERSDRARASRRDPGRYAPAAMLAPMVLVLAGLTLYPFLANLWYSVHAMDLTQPFKKGFVGFANFKSVLSSSSFGNALTLTAIFVVVALALELVLGFLVALALWRPLGGSRIFTTILILPFGLTPVALALAWRLLFNASGGGINVLFASLGLPPLDWTASQQLAMPSLILVDVWQWTPFVILILLAGLVALPKEAFEAAAMEGAGFWRSVLHVALPLLRPLILVVVLFRGIDLFRTFDTFWVITAGGPGNATETLNILLYRTAFQNLNFGRAAALALIMLAIALVISQPITKRVVAARDRR